MPIYEFECKNCGNIQENLMKISDPAPVDCNSCDQGSLVKIMSRTSFVLKGEGWYETDFKNNNARSKTKSPTDKPQAKESKEAKASQSPASSQTSSSSSADSQK